MKQGRFRNILEHWNTIINMEIQTNTTIGEIVRLNFKAARLFDKHHIDFCCGGDIYLSQACSNSGVDLNMLMIEIEELLKVEDPESKYIENMSLDQLCDYIVNRHHSYVNENIPFLQQKLQKLCDVHGSSHPELFEINKLFGIIAGNLADHLKKEELILFPLIRKMVIQQKEESGDHADLGEMQKTIAALEIEHQAEGERFGAIAYLSNSYTVPPDGCHTFDVTYRMLKEFEQDLHRHIHLESNVLFKKTQESNL